MRDMLSLVSNSTNTEFLASVSFCLRYEGFHNISSNITTAIYCSRARTSLYVLDFTFCSFQLLKARAIKPKPMTS